MKIEKYKKQANGQYKIYLDNKKELLLYEEVILKYELLLIKEITPNNISEIEKYNQECDVYHMAVKSLNNRYRTIKETQELLLKKKYPQELVDKTISLLVKQGYLNDQSFTKSYINTQIMITTKGPYKIAKELSLKGVNQEIIAKEISIYNDNTQLEKINKLTDKMLKSNRTKGGFILKSKISTYLVNQGYEKKFINTILNTKDFSNDNNLAKKEYEKLYKKLSRKYTGKELEYKIKKKLYQKGLIYED